MTLMQNSHGDLLLQRKNTFIYGIRSIQYSGARLWNTLPAPIRDSQSTSVFRSQVKAVLLPHHMEDWSGGATYLFLGGYVCWMTQNCDP